MGWLAFPGHVASPAATCGPLSRDNKYIGLLEPRVNQRLNLLQNKLLDQSRTSLRLQSLVSYDFCIHPKYGSDICITVGVGLDTSHLILTSKANAHQDIYVPHCQGKLSAKLSRKQVLASLSRQAMAKDKPHVAVTPPRPPPWPPAWCSEVAAGRAPCNSTPFPCSLQDRGQRAEAHPGHRATLCQHL